MLRHRQPSPRLWVYVAAAFLAGVFFSHLLLPSGSKPTGVSWQELEKRRVEHQQMANLDEGQKGIAGTGSHKKRLRAVIGVQTGFHKPTAKQAYNYRMRREALRKTWFPDSQAAADKIEEETGIMFRFVVGHSEDAMQEAEMGREIAENGAFLRLPVQEAYLSLTTKTLVFLQHVTQHYEADFIMKVDDDVYLRTDRLTHVMDQWKHHGADYIGCMKTGTVFRDNNLRWYEPQHSLIGGHMYFTHAWGSIYVLSGHAAKTLALVSSVVPEGLRFFNNEDVTVGGWMLAMNVTHLDDRRMCDEQCGPATLAVYDIPQCAGLCDAPKSLPLLHADPKCNTPTLDPKTGTIPTLEPYFWFVKPPKE